MGAPGSEERAPSRPLGRSRSDESLPLWFVMLPEVVLFLQRQLHRIVMRPLRSIVMRPLRLCHEQPVPIPCKSFHERCRGILGHHVAHRVIRVPPIHVRKPRRQLVDKLPVVVRVSDATPCRRVFGVGRQARSRAEEAHARWALELGPAMCTRPKVADQGVGASIAFAIDGDGIGYIFSSGRPVLERRLTCRFREGICISCCPGSSNGRR